MTTSRSRTGCMTCRSRKLKCSEDRPICAQCAKANRECVPSSGITFRHQQNPSMNGQDHGKGNLKSFYGYKETFGKDVQWVKVPRDLTFVNTNNPYDDNDTGSGSRASAPMRDDNALAALAMTASRYEEGRRGHEVDLVQAAYPQYHGLEALSAVVASQEYNFSAPLAPMGAGDQNPTHHPSLASSVGQHSQAMTVQHNALDYILNPSSDLIHLETSNIDPQLHAGMSTTTPHPHAHPRMPK